MNKYLVTGSVSVIAIGLASIAYAVPILQVGAPAGPGDTGTFADYQGSLSNPTENDTGVTSGSTLYVAGAYSANNPELLIGGQYNGSEGIGQNWSDFGFDTSFDSRRAALMAVVPDGTLAGGTLHIGGVAPFFGTETFESGFVMPNPPSNHAPVQNQAYMFFDLGDFDQILDNSDPLRLSGDGVPQFGDAGGEGTSNQPGEIKTLSITSNSGFDWIHFDAFALVTDLQGGGPNE